MRDLGKFIKQMILIQNCCFGWNNLRVLYALTHPNSVLLHKISLPHLKKERKKETKKTTCGWYRHHSNWSTSPYNAKWRHLYPTDQLLVFDIYILFIFGKRFTLELSTRQGRLNGISHWCGRLRPPSEKRAPKF